MEAGQIFRPWDEQYEVTDGHVRHPELFVPTRPQVSDYID